MAFYTQQIEIKQHSLKLNIANEVPVGNSEFNDILTADTEICSKNKNTKKIKMCCLTFIPLHVFCCQRLTSEIKR